MEALNGSGKKFLFRTMSDTVENDIRRVHVIANEILTRYGKAPLSFEQLRNIADGPFDLFLIPLIFAGEYEKNRNLSFNEAKRQEIRNHALEIARSHGFDTERSELIPGIEDSLKESREAGWVNVLLTSAGRRFKHEAMQGHGLGGYFAEIIDRDQNYFTKEQGMYYFFRKTDLKKVEIVLLTGTASYIRAGNNLEALRVGGSELRVFTVALSTEYSYNDEATLMDAQPKMLIRSLDELLPQLKIRGLAPRAGEGERVGAPASLA